MSPKEYVENFRLTNSPLRKVLTPAQYTEARHVTDAGYNFIASKVGEQYEEMTPEAVQSVEALAVMLCIFVEHATNPGLLRRAMAAS